ncbi:hypothetical protein ED733_004761 [Metarhizium rileyi]|uniref:Uncharacterized protein n=1 Tax=Metarhizium rileyi (strain RCEF 4871) TaxID=1649241 RepID=A0A5C6GA86_METRR|nr:hypothetical protein ED733_004761 [Metarhizium rileyi]
MPVKEKFPNFITVKPYLRLAERPAGKLRVQGLMFRKGNLETFGMKVDDGVMKVDKEQKVHTVETMPGNSDGSYFANEMEHWGSPM